MKPNTTVDVATARGRPMLTWRNKRSLDRVPVFPARTVEAFTPFVSQPGTTRPEIQNRLYLGDNKEVLAHLLAEGYRSRIALIYIDPPFDSGADYIRRVRLRGKDRSRLQGEDYSLGEQVQYADIWADDNYLQFMYERLPLMRELLAPEGSLWLHCDHRKVHHLRMLLEEVFGPENYLNTISWRSQVARGAKVNAFFFPFSTHYLEIFAKDRRHTTWNPPKKRIILDEEEAARSFMRDEHGFFRTSDPGSYSFEALCALHEQHRLYAPYGGQIIVDEEARRVYASQGGNVAVKYYLEELGHGSYAVERAIDNLWDDIPGLGTTPAEGTGYPTQKTEALLERIILASTHPGDMVLDCFVGSGTTPAVAQQLDRRWIGCDINRGAVQTTGRRLQRIILGQTDDAREDAAHCGFVTLQVNDYDLQESDPELRRLALEHIGARRFGADHFFDATLGSRLVKLARLTHPLEPATLAEIAAELESRPDETRDVAVVCLGATLAASEWLQIWNHFRRPTQGANHLELIDLRSGGRQGGFLIHRPPEAVVRITRNPEKPSTIIVEIDDFVSPGVLERLGQLPGSMAAPIDDWRVMVEQVAIDPGYDGQIFRTVVADVPHHRRDLVAGRYMLKWPTTTTVAVRITDVLGEEVLVTAHV